MKILLIVIGIFFGATLVLFLYCSLVLAKESDETMELNSKYNYSIDN